MVRPLMYWLAVLYERGLRLLNVKRHAVLLSTRHKPYTSITRFCDTVYHCTSLVRVV